MNWTNVKLVFLREVRDQLRDRRTLFMVAVLPLLLYPALGLGMFQMTMLFSDQPRTVVILGAADLPEPPLVEDGRFLPDYFEFPADAEKLHIITDSSAQQSTGPAELPAPNATEQVTLQVAKRLRDQIESIVQLEARREETNIDAERASIDQTLESQKSHIGNELSAAGMEVLILVPDGFRDYVTEANRQIAERQVTTEDAGESPRLRIVCNSADEKSQLAYRRVKEAVGNWEQRLLDERLRGANLPESLPKPVNPDQIDLAQQKQMAANVWSKMFPALLIIMAVTGAFYPAIDLGAGEKERGTMETLLISPATRTEIVTGKFFTVLLFSICTALLNLASIGFTGKHMLTIAGGGAMSKFGDAAFPPVSSLAWVLILAIPLAALFSSLSLGLAMFARSSKEGQYYLTPLLMVTMGLTVMCISPMYEITPFFAVMPVIGPALLLKALLLAPADPTYLYGYVLPVLVSSIGYSVLGLWWAIELFQREEVLFRGDDQFELGPWIKHLLRDKDPVPSFSESVFCFVIIMLLQFAALSYLSRQTSTGGPEQSLKLLIVLQLTTIATPTLLMTILLTTDLPRTLKLRWPSLKYFAVAIMLAIVLRPLVSELVTYLQQIEFLPDLDESMKGKLAEVLDIKRPGWLALLAIAVAPGICEEIAFRGFILTGLARNGRTTLAIVLSALAFGIVHVIPHQIFYTALLGLVLGLIAVRSQSLFPGIVFHVLFNGGAVLMSGVPDHVWTSPVAEWFFQVETTQGDLGVRHTWLTLVICGTISAVMLRWLIRNGRPTSQEPERIARRAGWAS